jgi:hypothetical protein
MPPGGDGRAKAPPCRIRRERAPPEGGGGSDELSETARPGWQRGDACGGGESSLATGTVAKGEEQTTSVLIVRLTCESGIKEMP